MRDERCNHAHQERDDARSALDDEEKIAVTHWRALNERGVVLLRSCVRARWCVVCLW
jgi:hypothetical protein